MSVEESKALVPQNENGIEGKALETLGAIEREAIEALQQTFIGARESESLIIDAKANASWELIKVVRDRISSIKASGGKTPRDLVRIAEDLQREYDEITGFAACQMESHNVVIRMDESVRKGKFAADDITRVVKSAMDLMGIASEGFGDLLTFQFSAFIPGSSCLAGDIDVSPSVKGGEITPQLEERIKKSEEAALKIVAAAPKLTSRKGTPAEKVNAFMAETGLDPQHTYDVMSHLQGLRKSKQTVALVINRETENAEETDTATLRVDARARGAMAKNKQHLAAIIEPMNERQFTGKIVELDHHKDDDLKFGVMVYAEGNKVYQIHYTPSEDDEVRDRKGTQVTLTAQRQGPNLPWYFISW